MAKGGLNLKKSAIIIFILIFILSLNACGAIPMSTSTPPGTSASSPVTPSPTAAPAPTVSAAPGVSTENVAQCVRFSVQNGKIYYLNSYDNGNLYSVNTDGTDNHKLSDDGIMQFCVSDDKIYYDNDSDGGKLYSMNSDGSGRRQLSNDRSSTVFWNVSDGRIYYNGGDTYRLYRMNTDGSGKKEVSDEKPLYTAVSGDRFYYLPELGEKSGIYSATTDGLKITKLTDDEPFGIIAYQDWLYYSNVHDDSKLYAMRTDGSDRHKLSDDHVLNINIAGGRIYYNSAGDGSSPIYSMNLDGSDRKLLSSDNADYLAVWDSRIYYTMTGANIYSINLDGADKQLVLNLDKDAYQDVTYETDASLHEGMPTYRFVATGKIPRDTGSSGYVMGLNGFDENGRSILSADFSQTMDDSVTGNSVRTEMMDTMGLHVVDVNFDGYKDVIILNDFSGAHGNTWYDCWLWDPKTSSFVKSESFSEICNPSLNPDNKCIYSTGGSGAAFWGGSIYQYIDGQFVTTNSLNTYQNGLTETKTVNGQMEIVRQVTYSDGTGANGQLEKEQNYYKNSKLWQLSSPRWYWSGSHQADQWLGG